MIEWINVKEIAQEYKDFFKEKNKKSIIKNSLWVFSCGDDPASEAYVKGKKKDCEEIGIPFNHVKVNGDDLSSTMSLIELLQENPKNKIIIQSPFKNKAVERLLMNGLNKNSDVDYLSNESIGMMYTEGKNYPATALGVKLVLNKMGLAKLDGKRVVVVGRSALAGAPCARILQDMGATVTIVHSKSSNYKDFLKGVDIVVLAVGKEGMFNEEDFSDGTIIFDVGITRGEDGKLHGDFVLKNEFTNKNLKVTPVPGGMGLMTRVGLIANIIGG